jgi:stearoyl-CoA desaturase (delta-9 desaturase)
VRDLARYRELAFLDRFDAVVPALLAAALYGAGAALEQFAPSLGTNGLQLLIWGFAVSTVAVWHATFAINSLAHTLGARRFATRDDSRNNFALALLTFGEGWHNNHHRFPAAARQGLRWWEIDLTYYALCGLELTGLIWELRSVPPSVYLASKEQRA